MARRRNSNKNEGKDSEVKVTSEETKTEPSSSWDKALTSQTNEVVPKVDDIPTVEVKKEEPIVESKPMEKTVELPAKVENVTPPAPVPPAPITKPAPPAVVLGPGSAHPPGKNFTNIPQPRKKLEAVDEKTLFKMVPGMCPRCHQMMNNGICRICNPKA